MKISYTFSIFSIIERFKHVHVTGTGKEAAFRQESQGWFFIIEPGFVMIFVGDEKPEGFKEGDKIKLTMEPANAVT